MVTVAAKPPEATVVHLLSLFDYRIIELRIIPYADITHCLILCYTLLS